MTNTEHNAATETETARAVLLLNSTELGYLDDVALIAPNQTVAEAIECLLDDVPLESEDRRYEILAAEDSVLFAVISAPRARLEGALADDSGKQLAHLIALAEDGNDPSVRCVKDAAQVMVNRSKLEAAEAAARPIAREFYNDAIGLMQWYVDLVAEERLNGEIEEERQELREWLAEIEAGEMSEKQEQMAAQWRGRLEALDLEEARIRVSGMAA
jgi:predicted RNA-binding protein Jag